MALTWHQESFILAHYGGSMSAKDIGKKLGMTKNAVVGHARRLGLSDPERQPVKKAVKPKPPRPMNPRSGPGRGEMNNRARLRPEQPQGVKLSRHQTCQWIDGQPTADDSCKCGKPAVVGTSWCAEHGRRAYEPVRGSRRGRPPNRAPASS